MCAINSFALDVNSVGPEFKLQGADGKDHSLSEYLGKVLVLEWLNHDCPFVKKHYLSGNMQTTQSVAIEKGANWVSIISSAPGKQGHSDAKRAYSIRIKIKLRLRIFYLMKQARLEKHTVLRLRPILLFLAKKERLPILVLSTVFHLLARRIFPMQKNYVLEALNEIFSGKKVSRAKTDSYGCSVKY